MNTLPLWLTCWAAACTAGEFSPLVGTIGIRAGSDEFFLDLTSGKVEEIPYGAQAWIAADSEDFARIAEGSANAQSLVAQGKVSFGGDVEVLHQFPILIERGKKAVGFVAH